MNILFLSYACEPGAGSEYGVGWMVPCMMAKLHPEYEVWVMTRRGPEKNVNTGAQKDKVEKIADEVDRLGLNNLHFVYYDQPRLLTYPNEMQSRWGEQINYLVWQWMVRGTVKRIVKEKRIDIVHHLTFNQYRTPSPGYWMKVPFVVGPIGGAETIAEAFWQDLEPHTVKKERIRQKGKDLKVFRWFNTRSNNKKVVLCSCQENAVRLKPFAGDSKVRVMPAIAYAKEDFAKYVETQTKADDGVFEMIYAGKALDWKGIHIFLNAVSRIREKTDKIRVKLIGIRFAEEQEKVKGWISELGLEGKVDLIPFMERSKLLERLSQCNLSVYPAFRDSGSMTVLEACALGCPSICFDAGGQDVFPDDILIKVRVRETYDECLDSFAERLQWAVCHPAEAKEIGQRAKSWVEQHMTWEQRVKDFANLYGLLTN